MGTGTPGRVFGTRVLRRGDACMAGRGDAGTRGRGDVGTGGGGDSGKRDRGRGEVRNRRSHFLLRMKVKYNFQRNKGRSLLEGPSEHRRTTLGRNWTDEAQTRLRTGQMSS